MYLPPKDLQERRTVTATAALGRGSGGRWSPGKCVGDAVWKMGVGASASQKRAVLEAVTGADGGWGRALLELGGGGALPLPPGLWRAQAPCL